VDGGESTLGPILARFRHLQHRYMQPHFARLGIFRGQPRVLFAVNGSPGISQVELTRAIHVQPPTATRMIVRMEEAGLLVREPDPGDHRANRVYLTPKGEEVLHAFRKVIAREEQEVFSVLEEGERRQLAELIQRLSDRYESALEGLAR